MTMPLLMNCEHQPEGLCDKCRKEYEGQCDDDHHAMMNGPRIRQALGIDKLSREDLALKISMDSVWKLRFKKAKRALRLCACPQPCATSETGDKLCDRCTVLAEVE